MAQKTIVTTHDDLDGREIDSEGKTVKFSLEGRQYEIDLHSDNLRGLHETFATYAQHARTLRGRPVGQDSTANATKPDTKAVRAWANAQGLSLAPRGRISAQIIEQYRAANA